MGQIPTFRSLQLLLLCSVIDGLVDWLADWPVGCLVD